MNRLSEAIKAAKRREEAILRRNLCLESETADEQPVLYLEVNIGADRPQGRLLIFEGDCPEEVVSCFASAYQLTENKRARLLEIVKQQLTRVLEKIGEVDDEEA